MLRKSPAIKMLLCRKATTCSAVTTSRLSEISLTPWVISMMSRSSSTWRTRGIDPPCFCPFNGAPIFLRHSLLVVERMLAYRRLGDLPTVPLGKLFPTCIFWLPQWRLQISPCMLSQHPLQAWPWLSFLRLLPLPSSLGPRPSHKENNWFCLPPAVQQWLASCTSAPPVSVWLWWCAFASPLAAPTHPHRSSPSFSFLSVASA